METFSPSLSSTTCNRNITQISCESDDFKREQWPRESNTRQAKRLQLRNAGFRGAALPTRKVTPKSPSSSIWSTSGDVDASSNENLPPSGFNTPIKQQRVSSGVLQEFSNSTALRPRKTRQRFSAGKISDSDGAEDKPSAPSKVVTKSRSVKTKRKVSQRTRSVSAETSRYIEHLESELAATQTQLSRINSPTVTRQHTSKLRDKDAETRQLQKQVEEWESKFEQRMQEEADRHYEVEVGLRGRIRTLELDMDEARFRIQELESQLQSTAQCMEAVEAANVNLERRIEIMSDLLATSPSKIDLHAQAPGRAKKHVRPKSMLPRFPTASSLLFSPERHTQTQPTSPLLTFTNYSPNVPSSPAHSVCRLDVVSQQSDYMSEAESVFSDASVTGDSMTSAENSDPHSGFHQWTLPPPPQHSRPRPARRMRRFGAGSVGPKPLILPSTSACEQHPPESSQPLERRETMPAFFAEQTSISDDSRSPLIGRRRASTMANGEVLHVVLASPFSDAASNEGADVTLMEFDTLASSSSRPATRDLSSFGSASGRNLMDELTAAGTSDSYISSDQVADDQLDSEHNLDPSAIETSSSLGQATTLVAANSQQCSPLSTGYSEGDCQQRQWTDHGRESIAIAHSASTLARIRFVFGDLWRNPFELAQHLVHTARGWIRIPRTLIDVQWWLVSALLGPMARRRMQLRPSLNGQAELEPLIPARSQSDGSEADKMAYGSLYDSPPSSYRRSESLDGGGKRRSVHKVRCPHRRSKHSPLVWLKFSLTLAFAIGVAFKDGPASLLKERLCACQLRRSVSQPRHAREEPDSLI